MRDPEVRAARLAMLQMPHIAPLTRYTEELSERLGVEVPYFDPADGGVDARILFLKEKPGPMTSARRPGRGGSGFISRDNDDPTAEATFHFMKDIQLDRRLTLMWNVIPGWNGTTSLTDQERHAGVLEVNGLLSHLPKLRVVVLVGKKAWTAAHVVSAAGLTVFRSYHPSRRVKNSYPGHWHSILQVWREAADQVRPRL